VPQYGHYQVIRQIGHGGLGAVYRAVDERSGRLVALKVLHRAGVDPVAARRLAREFKALSAIRHRNIVRVLDAGAQEEAPWLAMELVEGLPLRSYLDIAADDPDFVPHPPPPPEDSADVPSGPGGLPAWMLADDEPESAPRPRRRGLGTAVEPLPPERQAQLNRPARLVRLRDALAQLCDGLGYIHARGLVHRDLKPSNVLVRDDGCAKLVDFGLVKSTESSGNTTAAGHLVGTYRYMSPEQARGEPVDPRSDLWSLGCVLHEMLCGQLPFQQQQNLELLRAIVHEAPPAAERLNPGSDPVLCHVASRLLQKDPARRFQSADEVARLLRAAGA